MKGYSEQAFSGLPHYHGTNSKSYTLGGAITPVCPSTAVSLTQNIQSGGESSTTRCEYFGSSFDEDSSCVCVVQDIAGSADLVVAPPASPGASETTHHNCEVQSRTCQWMYTDQGGVRVCGTPLSCATAPEHFTTHGIEKCNKREKVTCWWHDCWKESRRSNIIRHVRERHLGHSR
ncbi:hypothetical protein BS17DRAFT_772488 [Gyrodon lividus]|nr:hypothetical protein BS17DRAFT_772488 [Gyrodon lividus]